MTDLKTLESREWLEKFFNIRTAIVELQPGETEEEAWRRHLAGYPEDLRGVIRIFNRRPRTPINN